MKVPPTTLVEKMHKLDLPVDSIARTERLTQTVLNTPPSCKPWITQSSPPRQMLVESPYQFIAENPPASGRSHRPNRKNCCSHWKK